MNDEKISLEHRLLRAIYKHLDKEAVLREFPALSQDDLVAFFKRMAARVAEGRPGSETVESVCLYTDGGALHNPGPAAWAFVIRSPNDDVLLERAAYLGRATNNVAEYKAVIAGLDAALALGAKKVSLRSDSELLIHQINGIYRVRNPNLKSLHDQVMERLKCFSSWEAQHIPREQNRHADSLVAAEIRAHMKSS